MHLSGLYSIGLVDQPLGMGKRGSQMLRDCFPASCQILHRILYTYISRSMLNPLLSTFSAPSPQQVPTAARLEGPVPNCANPSPNACFNANGSAYVCCSEKCAVPPGANPLCGQITPPVNTQVRFILCSLFHWRYMFDLTD